MAQSPKATHCKRESVERAVARSAAAIFSGESLAGFRSPGKSKVYSKNTQETNSKKEEEDKRQETWGVGYSTEVERQTTQRLWFHPQHREERE